MPLNNWYFSSQLLESYKEQTTPNLKNLQCYILPNNKKLFSICSNRDNSTIRVIIISDVCKMLDNIHPSAVLDKTSATFSVLLLVSGFLNFIICVLLPGK